MSRWKEAFENGTFKVAWDKLSDTVLSIQEEKINIEDATELARLKKVVVYLNDTLNYLDFDLVSIALFSDALTQHCTKAFNELSLYLSSQNKTNLINTNTSIDVILNNLKGYAPKVDEGDSGTSHSLTVYKESLDKAIKHFVTDLETKKKEVDENYKKINDFRNVLLDDVEGRESLKTKFEELLSSADQECVKIHSLYSRLFDGVNSISAKIEQAKIDAEKNAEAIRKAYAGASNNLEDIDSYYIQVMGEEDIDGVRSGGLKNELDKLLKNLSDFEIEQKNKYTALNEEIRSALPSATRAGLATAFSDMKKSFTLPIIINSIIFYLAVISLVGISIYFLIDIDDKGKIIVVTFTNLSDAFSNLAQKLPIILPLVWLAVFASKRRSESQRLQQEYAHKEALAFSYQNFKEQIDKLGAENKEEMLDKLLVSAIYAVASNASETLDKKHGDNSPIHDLFGGLVKSMWSKKKDKSE
ncbi:hypothetical protein [Marinomonas posidonica]|uniref:hypothetical protein n=1 Tax=Marinomonas posidonica TaxID=936476 RepID=UPI0037365304